MNRIKLIILLMALSAAFLCSPAITFAEPNDKEVKENPAITNNSPLKDIQLIFEQRNQAHKQAEEALEAYQKLVNTDEDEEKINAAKAEADSRKTLLEQLTEQLDTAYAELGDADKAAFDKIKQAAEEAAAQQAKIEALRDILKSIDAIKTDISVKTKEQQNALTEEEKKRVAGELKKLSERISALENDFSVIATGIDPKKFFEDKNEKVNWEDELQQIFSPFIIKLKEVSERPRQIETLKSELLYYQLRLPDIQRALATVEANQKNATTPDLKEELKRIKAFWQQQEKEFTTKQTSAEQQLYDLETQKESVTESAESFLSSFKTRALNVLLAIVAFVFLLLLFRFITRILQKINPLHKNPKYLTWANMSDLLLHALGIFISATAGFFVLYSSGDWLLIGLALLVLVALVWGLRNAVLTFWEQTRLVLNIGTVRKGERLIYQGLPYRVESIGIYCILKNPVLTGGIVRLPIQDLVGMRSRPMDEQEPWFPCTEGDYVLINYKTYRQVILATPNVVKFNWYDMRESMPTANFISQQIFNLSAGPYWAGITVHFSYQLQAIVQTEIMPKLRTYLAEQLKDTPFNEFLVAPPWVDMCAPTQTSIPVMIWLQLSKEAASKYVSVQLKLSNLVVGGCNVYGWEMIPHQGVLIQHAGPNDKPLEPHMNDLNGGL